MAAILLLMLIFTACGSMPSVIEDENANPQQNDDGFILYGIGSYDSEDTCILVSKNVDEKTLTFYNMTVSKNYTLEYDGTTYFYDKYGNSVSLDQIDVGEMVDVRFIKPKKHLTTLQLSQAVWAIEDSNRYDIDVTKRDITIGEDTYKISKDAHYFSKGKMVELEDLIPTDTLTFIGVDNTVYSIIVKSGHGYLRLTGQDYFVGGWIEIGTSIIQRVAEDMLITVPEGAYEVEISHAGTSAIRNVSISRDQESVLDFSDVVIEEAKSGLVYFSVSPVTAEFYVDGVKTDVSGGVELTYGLHQIMARAEGYIAVTEYINVGEASATINVTLEKNQTDKDEDQDKDKDSKDGDEDGTGDGEAGDGNGSGSADGSGDGEDGSGDGEGAGDGSGHNDGDGIGDGDDGSGDVDGAGDGSGDKDGDGTGNGDDGGSGDVDRTGDGSGDGEDPDGPGTPIEGNVKYYIYFDSPEGVELYFDGAYVDQTPCKVLKVSGSHIVTLCKKGFATKSYTINVGEDDKDVYFSFVELLPES